MRSVKDIFNEEDPLKILQDKYDLLLKEHEELQAKHKELEEHYEILSDEYQSRQLDIVENQIAASYVKRG